MITWIFVLDFYCTNMKQLKLSVIFFCCVVVFFFFDWINNEAQKVYDRAESRSIQKKWMLFLVKHGCWFFILCRWQKNNFPKFGIIIDIVHESTVIKIATLKLNKFLCVCVGWFLLKGFLMMFYGIQLFLHSFSLYCNANHLNIDFPSVNMKINKKKKVVVFAS